MTEFVVRPAQADNARAMAELMAAVAAERDGIATEPPVDIDERAALFARSAGGSVVAVAGGQIIGMLHVQASRHGFGELGMLVRRDWRGRGVGSALMQAAIDWARGHGLHKLCLEVFARNAAAIALARGVTSMAMEVLHANHRVLAMIERRWPAAETGRSRESASIHIRLPRSEQLPTASADTPHHCRPSKAHSRPGTYLVDSRSPCQSRRHLDNAAAQNRPDAPASLQGHRPKTGLSRGGL